MKTVQMHHDTVQYRMHQRVSASALGWLALAEIADT